MVKQTVRAQYFKKLREATFTQTAELTYTRNNLGNGLSYYICLARTRVSSEIALSKIVISAFMQTLEAELKADAANKTALLYLYLHKAAADCVPEAEDTAPTNSVWGCNISNTGNAYAEKFEHEFIEYGELVATPGEYLWIAVWLGVTNSTGIPANCTAYIRNMKASTHVFT